MCDEITQENPSKLAIGIFRYSKTPCDTFFRFYSFRVTTGKSVSHSFHFSLENNTFKKRLKYGKKGMYSSFFLSKTQVESHSH